MKNTHPSRDHDVNFELALSDYEIVRYLIYYTH